MFGGVLVANSLIGILQELRAKRTLNRLALLLAFAVGVADMAFPLLPRHLTLVGALTIGIPAFFLSLEPSVDRVRAGFVERALRFAVPAGVLVTVGTFAVYSITVAYMGIGLERVRTAAAINLFAVTLCVLTILARPINPRRHLLIAAMAMAFATVLSVPWLRAFFALTPLPLAVWLLIAVTASAAGYGNAADRNICQSVGADLAPASLSSIQKKLGGAAA